LTQPVCGNDKGGAGMIKGAKGESVEVKEKLLAHGI